MVGVKEQLGWDQHEYLSSFVYRRRISGILECLMVIMQCRASERSFEPLKLDRDDVVRG
jgi:hypothetical protein